MLVFYAIANSIVVKALAAEKLPAPPKLDPEEIAEYPSGTGRAPRVIQTVAKQSWQRRSRTMRRSVSNGPPHDQQGGRRGLSRNFPSSAPSASRENLLESILFPSRAVADQYVQWLVETKSGQAINGILIEETPDYLLLRDANAKDFKINRKDVEAKKKSPNSLMPDNLLLYLTEDELRSTCGRGAFCTCNSLKSPPVVPTTWRREERLEHLDA